MSGVEEATNTFDWIGLGIVGTFIGVTFSIIIGIINLRKSSKIQEEDIKLRFAETVEKFQHDLMETVQRQFNSDSIESSIRSTKDMLTILERLAYLKKLNKIDDKIISFFEPNFIVGHTLLKWLDIIYSESKNEIFYEHTVSWIKENDIAKIDFNSLPPKLFDMYDMIQSGKKLFFENGKYSFV